MVDDPLISLGGAPEQSPTLAGLAEREARRASQRADALREEVEALRHQLESLHAVTLAIWAAAHPLLEAQGQDEALVRAVETRLEKYDAWVRNEPAPCPDCGRPLAARSPRCIYCGHREG